MTEGGDRRTDGSSALGVRARVPCATLDEFVERFAAHVSPDGLFLHAREPRPVGSEIAFEILLAGGERALRGRGVVRSAWAPGAAGHAPGMSIRFLALDAPSRAVLERLLTARERRGGSAPGAPAPTPAPSAAAARRWAPPPSRAGDTFPPVLTPTPILPLRAARADPTAPHAVQRLVAGPLRLDLGLPAEPPQARRPSRAVVGIDLGTTNSCAAVVKGGKPYVIPSREGHDTVPSIVALNSRRQVVVGHRARAQLLSNPRETVHGTKRLIGRPFGSKPVQQLREAFAYDVVEGEDGTAAVALAGQRLSLEQVSALVLKELKDVAQDHLGEEVNRAVLTVPVYYDERRREAVRRAGALAGLRVERILDEPTAAALAYAHRRGLRQRVLVYDLGGGTFDASVLELRDGAYEVVSTAGDAFLGGADFDARIVAHLLERYAQAARRPFDGDPVALSRLVDAAERAKCALSERREFHVQLPFLALNDGAPVALDAVLTRDDVARLVDPLVERTLAVCGEALAAKGLSPADLDEVILVGGQSRMPLVHERVLAFFGKAPSRAVHLDEAVALGAALVANALDAAGSSRGLRGFLGRLLGREA